MQWLIIGGWVLAGIMIFYLLDRLATWMESKGWLYWRKRGGAYSRLGNAFLEMQAMFEPGKKYVIEAKQEVKRKKADSGDPPSPENDSQPHDAHSN